MKRTCNGCRALSGDTGCSLGYERKFKSRGNLLPSEYVPAEECPKPLTYDRFFALPKKWEISAQTTQENP